MKGNFQKVLIVAFVLTLIGVFLWNPRVSVLDAQGAPARLTQTTLSAAQTATQQSASLSTATGASQSAGNLAAPSNTQGAFLIYIDREAERVTAVSGTTVTVQRGFGGTAAQSHANAATVWFGLEGQFMSSDPPQGSCTSPVVIVPWINVLSGNTWMCRSSTWKGTNAMVLTFGSTPTQTSLSP